MAIPTRFNMGQVQGSGADYFLRLLQEQGGAGARPSASITGGLSTARRGTPLPLMRKRPPMPQIGLRGIRDISALPAGGSMTSLQRDLAAKMGLGAQKPQAPKAPPSLMDRLTPAVGTPAFAGLSEAAATGLQLSGYQDKPITTGQGLGAMMQAGMKAFTEAKAAQKPEIKVAGDKVFRIYPDGRTELLSGSQAKKPVEVKGEAGRMQMPDGRITQGVYDKAGNLYEIGNMAEVVNPKDVKFIDQFTSQSVQQLQQFKTDQIKPKEKTLKYIDTLADQIDRSPSGWAERQKAKISTAIKRFAGNSDYTEEELMMALSRGTLTALVGASRLELFGPGVLTEAEAELARQVFVGEFDSLNRTEALARLKSFRDMTLEGYVEDIGVYNTSPATTLKYQPYYEKSTPIFDWDSRYGAEADVSVQQSPAANQSGSTSGGNTWTVVR